EQAANAASRPADATASRVVTVTQQGTAAAGITVLTEAVAIKETGPRATVRRFGEVYAFSPAFIGHEEGEAMYRARDRGHARRGPGVRHGKGRFWQRRGG